MMQASNSREFTVRAGGACGIGADARAHRPAAPRSRRRPRRFPKSSVRATARSCCGWTPPACPGVTLGEVREVELPAGSRGQWPGHVRRPPRLQASSRASPDESKQARVSQWDNVRRGEPIVALYSPDFMTAEAEYLQAKQTAHLSRAPGIAAYRGAGGLDGGRGRAQAGVARNGTCGYPDDNRCPIRRSGCARRSAAP